MDTDLKYNSFENEVTSPSPGSTNNNNKDKPRHTTSDKTCPTFLQTCLHLLQKRATLLSILILAFSLMTLLASLVLIVSVSRDASLTKSTTLGELSQLQHQLSNTTSILLQKLSNSNTLKLCAKGYNCVNSRYAAHAQLRCFHLNTTLLSWHQARKSCRDLGGFLAEVHDYATLDFLVSFLRTSFSRSRFTKDVWLGGTDNSTANLWLWDTTRTSFTKVWNWEGTSCVMPSYQILRKDCLKINARTGKWCHEACSERRPFMCQMEGQSCADSDWH